jgi:putative endonuclease
MWFVYILRSQTNNKLYTGISTDPLARLQKHNEGKGAKYTRTGRPWSLAFVASVGEKGDALREEARIKKLTRAQKLRLVGGTNGGGEGFR